MNYFVFFFPITLYLHCQIKSMDPEESIFLNATVLKENHNEWFLPQENITNGKIHYDNCIIFHCYVPELNLETIACLRLSKKYFWKNNKIFSNLPIGEKGKSALNQLAPCLVSASSPKLKKAIHETLDIIVPSVKIPGILILM